MPRKPGFAVWLTGLPASGKSAIAAVLKPKLETLGLRVEVLESDALRQTLTPAPTYSREERDLFYRALAVMGSRLAAQGVAVIFDATANRRAYRDFARTLIPNVIEVSVECPLETCMERDRKGTYRKGRAGESATVPGLQDPYEPPLDPALRIDTTRIAPEAAADLILASLRERQLLTPPGEGGAVSPAR
ncbi:MAG: adenylyl-sulfate kinase [Nitrospirae bacterium]|nr:MAG: adenylyl-sulfate kinase [Nitrospirota bacterium]